MATRDSLLVLFDRLARGDTTGTHLLKALEALVPVEYYAPLVRTPAGLAPRGYAELDQSRVRALLCIDDDHGWPLPETVLPMYYWCIDSYRMDAELYLGGTRRGRLPAFTHVFHAQACDADAFGGTWLPVAVDTELYTYSPQPTVYDWAFIGNMTPARAVWLPRLQSEFPKCFFGTGYSHAAINDIYNQSALALNLSGGNDLNMRMFEGQATSALLLANKIDNGESRLFPHVALYTTLEDCIAQMRMWLANPALRTEVARAQAADMATHTYMARAKALLKAICWPEFG